MRFVVPEGITPVFGPVSFAATVPPPIAGGRLRLSHSVSAPAAVSPAPPKDALAIRVPLLFHGRYCVAGL